MRENSSNQSVLILFRQFVFVTNVRQYLRSKAITLRPQHTVICPNAYRSKYKYQQLLLWPVEQGVEQPRIRSFLLWVNWWCSEYLWPLRGRKQPPQPLRHRWRRRLQSTLPAKKVAAFFHSNPAYDRFALSHRNTKKSYCTLRATYWNFEIIQANDAAVPERNSTAEWFLRKLKSNIGMVMFFGTFFTRYLQVVFSVKPLGEKHAKNKSQWRFLCDLTFCAKSAPLLYAANLSSIRSDSTCTEVFVKLSSMYGAVTFSLKLVIKLCFKFSCCCLREASRESHPLFCFHTQKNIYERQ